ncbi:hypothetical protein PoB_002678700 [Plakobranchus ocellatus]|uniref:Uncharacterized protein n=1 Tax=Plakobranchus ocellatus TaxID=259542 RepID=A0AAV4A0A7_9GAST|nr:hypothetical protein PoB_002678700 [Plakobranchus ocellatus]
MNDFCTKPVHNKVISGFQGLRQAKAPVARLESATKGSCRSQGGLASHCATDVPHHRCKASPQQGDLRFSGSPSGQGDGGEARIRDIRVPADLRADSLATVSKGDGRTPDLLADNISISIRATRNYVSFDNS